MYMLVLQTFLLMMAAFLLGATMACLLKRTVHRFSGVDASAPVLHVDVPPAVQRTEPAYAHPAPPPVAVTRAETQRFERALHGEVASADVVAPTVRQAGPVVEVQPVPVAPAVVVAAPPASAPRTRVEVAEVPAAVAPKTDTRNYAEIAVSSHDGSMLPPAGVREAKLAPPVMPGPAPQALAVTLIPVPAPVRPGDAHDGPHGSYTEESLRAGYTYSPAPAPAVTEYQLPEPTDLDHYEVPGDGESYASIAVGGRKPKPAPTVAPAAAVAAAPQPAVAEEAIGTTLATAALATAASIAAQRSADVAGADDLTRIQGIDEVVASRLNFIGVTRFAQIAHWNADDVRLVSQSLGFFGRVEDEYWIDQARQLAGIAPRPIAPPAPVMDSDAAEEVLPSPATPANAADIATAAAAAAAAAMAVASHRSPATASAPSAERSGAASDVGSEAATAAAAAAAAAMSAASRRAPAMAPAEGADVASEDGNEATAGRGAGLTGLRSVRSEGLRGDDAQFVRGDLDDLKRIRGIGVLIEKKLNSLGITSYEQVANWSAADVERLSDVLDFKGRIERENWIEQARILASGGQTEFSRRVDRGEA
jgi:predicted flap endonuclease-1-like 5' DNA nuclease